jgi:uncharacterized membrane protein YcgQ (UPF0703/DUF1980 family)
MAHTTKVGENKEERGKMHVLVETTRRRSKIEQLEQSAEIIFMKLVYISWLTSKINELIDASSADNSGILHSHSKMLKNARQVRLPSDLRRDIWVTNQPPHEPTFSIHGIRFYILGVSHHRQSCL